MQKRKAPPPTDRPVSSSSAGGSVGSTARLEQLRNKARETGDYSEVAKYKASMKK